MSDSAHPADARPVGREFAWLLPDFRRAIGLEQWELAMTLGMSASHLSRIHTGLKIPTEATVRAIIGIASVRAPEWVPVLQQAWVRDEAARAVRLVERIVP